MIAQASNGDVITTNFATDYDVIESKNTTIEDGTGKTRESLKLKLISINNLSTYQNVILYLDKHSLAPILAEFSGTSERIIKKAYYLDYQLILGANRPSKIAILD